MKAVIQRVTRAAVSVDGEMVGSIGHGLLVLVGVAHEDTETEAAALAEKIGTLRIFGDAEGKMNLSLQDVGGSALIVSQFTLLGDARRGRRPSFVGAAPPDLGERLYERVADLVERAGIQTARGRFGAHMQVSLVNDGPVTILLEFTPKPA